MIELRSLVEVALRRFGCHLEAEEENLLHVAIPANSPVRQILDVGETAYLALVQFEEDRLANLDPVRHLIPGSIYLERFIGILTEHGAVGDVTLPKVYARPADDHVRSVLTDSLRDAGVCEMFAAGEAAHRCVTFHFIVDLFAIEASKTLLSVTFDFDEGRLISNSDVGWLRDAEPAAVEVTQAELQMAARAVLERVRDEACRLIEAYTEEHSDERSAARRRLQRLAKKQLDAADTGPAPAIGEPVEDQLEELARDWDLRIRHADSQYKADGAQVTLVSATRQLRPFAVYEIRFPHRSGVETVWKVLYDLNCGSYLLPVCHSCGSDAGKPTAGEGTCAHPLCERCAEIKPSCRHLTCKRCVRKCFSCTTTMCGDCGFDCGVAGCSATLCEKHKVLCSKCHAYACAQHRLYCKACRRTFCAECYPHHKWRQADCGHMLDCGPKPAVCGVCKGLLCAVCTEKCQRCGRYTCSQHVEECFSCSLLVCRRCAGINCETCKVTSCKEHSLRCKVCALYFCDEHAQPCAVCSQPVCNSHVVACARCLTPLCPKHSQRRANDPPGCRVCDEEDETELLFCNYCQGLLPPDLLTPHDGSEQLICVKCRLKCPECDEWSQEFDFIKCAACGRLLCDGCLDDHAYICPALGSPLVIDFG